MSQKPDKGASTATGAQKTELIGQLDRFRFRNQDTGFGVVRFVPDGDTPPMAAVGMLAQLSEGQRVKVTGKITDHPRFGRQIEVEVAEALVPSSIEGIEAYLSSRLIKGIGPAIAARITEAFGDDALRIIEEEPRRLTEIKGLGAKRAKELSAAVAAQKDVQDVMVFLRTHGLGQGLASRIVKRYGRGASALIEADPYRLVDDVIGIGFQTADKLGHELGLAPDGAPRIRAGILHILAVASRDGHCHLPEDDLIARSAELLRCSDELVTRELPELAIENKVVLEPEPSGRRVYPLALHQAEVGVARRIDQLLRRRDQPLEVPADAVAQFERTSGMPLPTGQRDALTRALTEPVSVITGGPGVGKTTIIRALTEILGAHELEVRLAAPTGRAAKRLEESTGRSATTIHRLLEYQPGVNRFARDERDPIEGDMLVVDEASMLDVNLAYNLLRAIPDGMKLVLVGDIDQLPAVGPGHVLGDIITSRRPAVTALTEIFRQRQDSLIVQSAHAILRGETPRGGGEGADFFIVEAPDPGRAREMLREMIGHRIPRAFGLDPMRDVQVLCPMYRGEVGADNLNRDLQEALNPGQPELERGRHRYRLGDKVMQIRNDYDLDVFNGDMGHVVHLDGGAKRMSVRFGERVVNYAGANFDQLVPAYAISVHRAQGSEYPAIVMPLATDHFMMLRRNLVYTAITRARRLVVLVGSARALEMAVHNNSESQRHTGLVERLADPS